MWGFPWRECIFPIASPLRNFLILLQIRPGGMNTLEMGGRSSHVSGGQASLDLTVTRGAGKTMGSGVWGQGHCQGLVPAYAKRLRTQRHGWGRDHQIALFHGFWMKPLLGSTISYSVTYVHFIILHLWECSLTLGQSRSPLYPSSRMEMR